MRYSIILCALLLAACRTIWVHPEATAEKYAGDTHFCQRGVERSGPGAEAAEVDPERAFALEATRPTEGDVRPGWKRCMVRLGWDTSFTARSKQPYRTPDEAPLKQGR